MAVKMLLSGLANVGKTKAISTLKDVLVIAIDNKKYPHMQPHVNVNGFVTMDEFISVINEKITTYEEKIGEYPKVIVFDTVTRMFEVIVNSANKRFVNFDIHANIGTEVAKFNDYIEDVLIANDIDIVLVSHAVYDSNTNSYELPSSGAFSKKGGFLSTVDNASFMHIKGGKYMISHTNAKHPCRSNLEDIPKEQLADDYVLQDHIDALRAKHSENASFEL